MDARAHQWTGKDLHIVAVLAKAASTQIALSRSRVEVGHVREEPDALRAAGGRRQFWLMACLPGIELRCMPDARVARELLALIGKPWWCP